MPELSQQPRFNSVRCLARLVVWCSIAHLAEQPSLAHADEAIRSPILNGVLTRSIVNEVCRELCFDESQRDTAIALFFDYHRDVRELNEATRRRQQPHFDEREELLKVLYPMRSSELIEKWIRQPGGLKQLQHMHETALRELRDDPRWERVHELTRERKRILAEAHAQHERLFQAWLSDVAAAVELHETEAMKLGRIARRYTAYLRRPAQPALSRRQCDDFSAHIDLTADIRNAQDIAAKAQQEANRSGNVRQEEAFWEEKDWILTIYHERLDELLQEKRASWTEQPAPDTRFLIHPDDPEYGRHRVERIRESRRWLDLFMSTTLEVRELLREHFDDPAAQAWQNHVDRLLCPDLTRPRWASSMVEWAKSRSDLTDEQIANAQRLIEEYEPRHNHAVRRALETGFDLRRATRDNSARENLQRAHVRALLGIHRVNRETVRRFLFALTPLQQRVLAREIRRTSNPFGPSLNRHEEIISKHGLGERLPSLPWDE